MNEGLMNLADDDSSRDVQLGARAADDDRLATTRLAAHAVPPPAPSPRSAAASVSVPQARPSYPSAGSAPGMLYPSEAPAALPRTSWWRSLIASTAAPARGEDTLDHRAGKVCIGLSVGFALAALLVGLRAAPADAPAVAVAVVVSRAALALGLLVFGHALLRTGERLLAGGPRRTPEGTSISS